MLNPRDLIYRVFNRYLESNANLHLIILSVQNSSMEVPRASTALGRDLRGLYWLLRAGAPTPVKAALTPRFNRKGGGPTRLESRRETSRLPLTAV